MDSKRVFQFGPTAFAVAPLVAVLFWAGSTEMPDEIQAPLYAIVAATGLAMALVPRPKHEWDTWLNLAIQIATAFAAWFSAHQWLLSEDAGTATRVVASVWVIAVAVFVAWHVHEQQPKDEAHLEKAEEVD